MDEESVSRQEGLLWSTLFSKAQRRSEKNCILRKDERKGI